MILINQSARFSEAVLRNFFGKSLMIQSMYGIDLPVFRCLFEYQQASGCGLGEWHHVGVLGVRRE